MFHVAAADKYHFGCCVYPADRSKWGCTISKGRAFFWGTANNVQLPKAGCNACQLSSHTDLHLASSPQHIHEENQRPFLPLVSQQTLSLWTASSKQWDNSRILLWYIPELRYVHDCVTLCMYLSERFCTNRVREHHLPKDTLWYGYFKAHPSLPAHPGLLAVFLAASARTWAEKRTWKQCSSETLQKSRYMRRNWEWQAAHCFR